MGSCKTSSLIHNKAVTKTSGSQKYLELSSDEIEFFQLLYRELCIRNNSKKYLEKSTFLLLIKLPGVFGERLFDFLDHDKDGYISEEQFIGAIEKYQKIRPEELCCELFSFSNLKETENLDKKDFTITFYSMIQEIIEGLERSLGQSPINEILAVNRMQSTNIVKLSSSLQKDSSSISTLGSLNEFYNAGKTYPEKFIKCIFDKFSSNGLELTKSEFTDFFLSQPWILTNIQESFKISNWINVPKPKPGRNVPFVQYSTIGPSCTAKVQIFFRGNWIRRNVEIRENYLLFYLEKKHILDEIMYLEGCFVKVKESSLYIIYSTQYDERLSLRFTTKEECIIFAKEAKIAGKIHSFKEYYKRGESLGHGKFSDVYVATELATNSTWAVKCIHKRMMDQSERELIRKELTILSSLNFHGIVKFKEVFETRKHVMVVMEKMEGTDLLKKINGGMLDEYEIKSIIRQILQAVCYIHQLGVIHRDLKPENVLVTKIADDFNVKLIDFGLATYYFPKNKMNYCCGTLGYTAPEIFSGNYNTKIDVWSIGIITFAMISGKLPFYSHFKDETIEMTQTQPVLFEGEKWDKCSENAKDFIENLLRKDPDVRYDCLQALDHAWLHN